MEKRDQLLAFLWHSGDAIDRAVTLAQKRSKMNVARTMYALVGVWWSVTHLLGDEGKTPS